LTCMHRRRVSTAVVQLMDGFAERSIREALCESVGVQGFCAWSVTKFGIHGSVDLLIDEVRV